ncbi:biopolymer transporter ExbD [Psychrobium sp. MM17-31]|uniref:biopolymer transporter ExbD n=1 Tax=Psychrobium sp. MM17-31 TaxID=2917758 RepID=UPI001EF69F94|nr:biopolymer transporter ExbD [Psychrobium sp. MM17-31]MCG7532317.1 biopolymer transporter ExbD [Psychrobium sp. MM17-31]
MAFNMQNDNDEFQEQHEINVTPFIDVILVLLIIFMVAAPLATVSVPVNLPTSTASKEAPKAEPVYLTLQQDLTLTLGEKQQVSREQLTDQLLASDIGIERQIYLRADKSVPYGELMQVMNVLAQAGYVKIALMGLEAAAEK